MMFKLLSVAAAISVFIASTSAVGWSDVAPYRDALITQLNVLNAALDAIPTTGGTAEQAQTVASILTSTSNSYDSATTVYKATLAAAGLPPSSDAGNGCSNDTIIPATIALNSLAVKKDAFDSTGSTTAIKTGIDTLQSSTSAFIDIWTTIAPPGFEHIPVEAKTAFDTGFAQLATTYN